MILLSRTIILEYSETPIIDPNPTGVRRKNNSVKKG